VPVDGWEVGATFDSLTIVCTPNGTGDPNPTTSFSVMDADYTEIGYEQKLAYGEGFLEGEENTITIPVTFGTADFLQVYIQTEVTLLVSRIYAGTPEEPEPPPSACWTNHDKQYET
jgi:hypothetical protein